ncbi:protein TolQ [Pelagibaculum spongiae]|uniref:protein TolQ n=1 Tax=Pelagibaculum spongiae TaxID=2080658 RepID=UPI00272CB82B|nr:protein TolQ [Pelagibaculum spongiae]
MSILSLFIDASLLVQAIMLLLAIASLVCWSMIFARFSYFRKTISGMEQFEDKFWSGIDLSRLYTEVNGRIADASGVEKIFHSGFKEFIRLRKQANMDSSMVMEGTHRAMRVTLNRENEKLENHLNFLATVGSTSPYVGLFGTVWGIMHSFIALGSVQQATLAMVAPGIAEALVATAMGLFAAIPAVVAYNRFANNANKVAGRYDTFMEEFSGILHRQAHARPETAA